MRANVLPIIRDIQRAGASTLRDIADALNARGIATARGGRWYAMTCHQRTGQNLMLGPAFVHAGLAPLAAQSATGWSRFGSREPPDPCPPPPFSCPMRLRPLEGRGAVGECVMALHCNFDTHYRVLRKEGVRCGAMYLFFWP